MTAQSVAGLPFRDPAAAGGARQGLIGRPLSRRALGVVALVGAATMLLTLAALVFVLPRFARPGAPAAASLTGQGAPWPSPVPLIRSSELWYATTPAPGVWAELKIVLDNPLQARPGHTTLLVSGTVLEDFRIRSTEPKLLMQPRRRPDGRYALVFPAPIPESLNWYRVYLVARRASPRPLALSFMLDGVRNMPEQAPTPAQIFYADRQADPFMVVPEPLVGWVPGQARSAFPILVLYAVAIGAVAAAGCAAAFWAIRRQPGHAG